MVDTSDLSPREQKILYAQSYAYLAFTSYEHDIFASVAQNAKDDLRSLILADILELYRWAEGDSEQSAQEFLGTVPDRLAAALEARLGGRQRVKAFHEAMLQAVNSGMDLASLVDSWFVNTVRLGEQYIRKYFSDPPIVFPKIELSIAIDLDLEYSPAGKTESRDGDTGARKITVLLNPSKFPIDGFFAIPSLISHEFWCHGLSNLGEPLKGCDPASEFEEGWMHYIQSIIFGKELEAILGGSLCIGSFEAHGNSFTGRLRTSTASREHGFRAAAELRYLLRTITSDADSALIEMSLDLNRAVQKPQFKNRFVDRIADRLQSGARDCRPDPARDRALEKDRSELAEGLRACQEKGHWRVHPLFKLLYLL